jgi:23S rRNA (uracil1939-C5)-methyltransferase
VARSEGLVWFVAGGLPGDIVLAEPVRRRASFVEATVAEIVEPSPERRQPACPVQDRCGGCPWMPLDEALQRSWKQRLIRDAMERIGGLKGVESETIRVPSSPLGYRNRVEFTVRWGGPGRPLVGFHAAGSPGALVDIERCLLQSEAANRVLDSVREYLAGPGSRAGRPRGEHRVVIRSSSRTGEILVGLREAGDVFPRAPRLARFLSERHPEIVGVVRLRAPAGRRGGTRSTVLAGRGGVVERVAGIDLWLPAASFLQVSTAGAEELVQLVGELAGPTKGRRVLDLYGGLGLFGIDLLRRGAIAATVCEADAEAVACARELAREREDLTGLEIVHAEVRDFLERGQPATIPDVVVANPPRAGLGRPVAAAIRRLHPPRLILVSCDPPTLARDLKVLLEDGSYRVERIVPVDLFPQTAHIETAVLLVG